MKPRIAKILKQTDWKEYDRKVQEGIERESEGYHQARVKSRGIAATKVLFALLLLMASAATLWAQDAPFDDWLYGLPIQTGWTGLTNTLKGNNGWPAAFLAIVAIIKISVKVIRKAWEMLKARAETEDPTSVGHELVDGMERTTLYKWLSALGWIFEVFTSIPVAKPANRVESKVIVASVTGATPGELKAMIETPPPAVVAPKPEGAPTNTTS